MSVLAMRDIAHPSSWFESLMIATGNGVQVVRIYTGWVYAGVMQFQTFRYGTI